ncbi:hypothetical protein GZ77_24420 [Endozoicomonas montiporae]|uniref:Uncharacterized protein n=2 Tax=Endozoicomonas montiporae TaxID=1027273 RepID=A0A081MZP1_9GAMM|nr:hypothetical protein GZ77_24420 [Endozoicomonas montiporae]
MRAQNHMLEQLDAIIQSLNAPEPSPNNQPFTIIHINENGEMNRLVPPDKKAFQQDPAKADSARSQLTDSIRKIDKYYTREKTSEFRNELNDAEAILVGFAAQLQGRGINTPPIPKGFASISINDFLRTRQTDTTPATSSARPAQPSPVETPAKDDWHYQPEPAHQPEIRMPYQESPPPPPPPPGMSKPPPPPPPPPPPAEAKGEKKPPNQRGYLNPDVSPDSLAEQPAYLAAVNRFRVFQDPAKKAGPVSLSAPLALEAGDPQHKATDPRFGNTHTSRKALLFELLIKQHRMSTHPEAVYLNSDIVRLIQLGIMATGVSEQDLLNKKPDPRAEAECKAFLLECESVTPPVADFVAGIVAGTGHQDSLAAKVMRDTIRLEDMRFCDDFDINRLESNQDYELPMVQQQLATRFCDQWRRLLAREGELTNAAQLQNRATSVPPTVPNYLPQDDANLRARLDKEENPYDRHVELLYEDDQLGFLKNLLEQ